MSNRMTSRNLEHLNKTRIGKAKAKQDAKLNGGGTGHQIKVPGFKSDKSGTQIVRDLKGLSVSKQLQKKGKQKMTWGRGKR